MAKSLILRAFFDLQNHSHSTATNQFCLDIICYRICLSFDSLSCPYYPAYISYCYHFVIGIDNTCSVAVDN
ncbi:MAG: hypothetical protein ACLU3G_03665, partial [Christensenellales bacterium]